LRKIGEIKFANYIRTSIAALAPARTAFGALQIPNANKTCGFVLGFGF
jgi:hypothetical protein